MSQLWIWRWIGVGALGLLHFPASHTVRGEKAASEAITFHRAAWRAGDRVESESRFERALDYQAMVDGEEVGGFAQKGSEIVVKSTLILEVEECQPTKIRVRYDEHAETDESGEGEAEEVPESLLEGRTFVLELRDGQVDVRGEEGQVLDEEVEDMVRTEEVTADDRLDVGVDKLAELVAEKPRRIGEKIDVPEELALEVFSKRGSAPPQRVEIHLALTEVREIDGVSCGVFDTSIEIEGTEDDIRFTSEFEGETWIAVDSARFQGAKMSGRMQVDGTLPAESGGVELSGEGTIEIVQSRSYSRD